MFLPPLYIAGDGGDSSTMICLVFLSLSLGFRHAPLVTNPPSQHEPTWYDTWSVCIYMCEKEIDDDLVYSTPLMR